jgi:hypothetical protein
MVMKKLLMAIVAILPLAASAQEQITVKGRQEYLVRFKETMDSLIVIVERQGPLTFEQLQQMYAHRPGYTVVRITSDMLKDMENLAGVEQINILTREGFDHEFTKQMARVTYQKGFKRLVAAEGNGQYARFYFRALPDGRVSDLIMASWGYEENMLMVMHGNFSVSQIRQIANAKSRTTMPKVTVFRDGAR